MIIKFRWRNEDYYKQLTKEDDHEFQTLIDEAFPDTSDCETAIGCFKISNGKTKVTDQMGMLVPMKMLTQELLSLNIVLNGEKAMFEFDIDDDLTDEYNNQFTIDKSSFINVNDNFLFNINQIAESIKILTKEEIVRLIFLEQISNRIVKASIQLLK